MSSTWNSGIGKFPKKDPNHGAWARKIKGWWKKFKHRLCSVGLCNLDKCKCNCHCKGRSAAWNDCRNPDCKCKKD